MDKNLRMVCFLVIILLFFTISACSTVVQNTPSSQELASMTVTNNYDLQNPTSTSTSTPTPTTTPLPTLSFPVSNNTPYPENLTKLEIGNVSEIQQIGHYGSPVTSYCLSSGDQKRLFVQASDGLRIYQMPEKKLIVHTNDILDPNEYDPTIQVSEDGKRYAYVDKKIYVKNDKGETLLEVENPYADGDNLGYYGKPFVFSPDGKILLVPIRDYGNPKWSIFDVDAKTKLEKTLNPKTPYIAFTPDSERLIAYDSMSGYMASYLTTKWIYEFSTAFDKNFSQLTFSPDHSQIAITVNDLLRIYDFNGVVIKREVKITDNLSGIRILGFSNDNSELAFYSGDEVKAIEISTGEISEGGDIAYNSTGALWETNYSTYGCDFATDSSNSLISKDSFTDKILTFSNGKFEMSDKQFPQDQSNNNCSEIETSEDGDYKVCYDKDLLSQRIIYAYLYNNQTKKRIIGWDQENPEKVYFAPNGKFLTILLYRQSALGSNASDQIIHIYDLANNLPILNKENVYDSTTNRVNISDVLAYSPDSTMLLYVVVKQDGGNNKTVVFQFLSSDKGQKNKSITVDESTHPGIDGVTSLAISPDNSILAVGTENGEIILYDITSQAMLASWQGQNYGVRQLMFAPDQTSLGSLGEDGYMNIWELAPEK